MSIVGKPATGSHARCSACGYGTVQAKPGAPAYLVHAADCPEATPFDAYVACRNRDCKRVLDPERVRRDAATTCGNKGVCRAAAWRQRTGYGRHDGSQEPREARTNGCRAKRPRASGLQISYRKTTDILTAYLAEQVFGQTVKGWGNAREVSESLLSEALSERQRQQLQQREEQRT